MKQYCRYCGHCFFGDDLICGIMQQPITEESAKRVNNCRDFAFVEEDVFNPDHKYKPRQVSELTKNQIKFNFNTGD